MDYSNKCIKSQRCLGPQEVCDFLQQMTDNTVISITQNGLTFTIFYY